MAKYKLLKDLPDLKKDTILSEGEPIFGMRTLITKNNSAGTIFIGNELFEEFFEEIQEESTDSIHWKPEYGDIYWFLGIGGKTNHDFWTGTPADFWRYGLGKIYRTKEECEKASDRELAEARLRRTSTFEPDFENRNGGWIVVYNYAYHKLFAENIRFEDAGEPVRYATKEDAEKSIKENEQDWKIYFGIEEEE